VEENQDNVNKRIQDFYRYEKETWSSVDQVGSGIFVYRDLVPKHSTDKLEEVLNDSSNVYFYQEAMVGYGMKMPDYRDCFDFKYKRSDIEHDNSDSGEKLKSLWQELYDLKLPAVKNYCRSFNIGEIRYWEAMNFVKYGPGQHFQEHTDHGYSYNCVVSLVGYPNDDYEGGELEFRLQRLKIKPRAGDLFVFPSNFMYPHKSLPVVSGTKYSIVTMLDYSDKFHNNNFYQETGN
jgi:hypothetical protein